MGRALWAEGIGTLFLVMASLGAGIMGERLAPGQTGLILMANAGATGLALYVLIQLFAPLSGAQFNPAVSLWLTLCGRQPAGRALTSAAAQIAGALAAVPLTHAMFGLPLLQTGTIVRATPGLWLGEAVATLSLLMVIAGARGPQAPGLIAAWVAAAYWFTSSAIFGNPAVTLARTLTDTFTGIRPADAPAYILVQCLAAVLGAWTLPRLFAPTVGQPR